MTPEPLNPDAIATVSIAKSLSEFTREISEGDHTLRNGIPRTQAELPTLLFLASELHDLERATRIVKSLEATGTVPVDGTQGFDAIKTSDIGAPHTSRCAKCDHEQESGFSYCPHCGTPAKSTIQKSMGLIAQRLCQPRASIEG